ncbi:DRTGG domain-containing protein [Macrococcus brunensis]|uniref:DRTGG domain-containing protein n=1 Tax=Macrococcus brunensis TaxID=198483 RepID=UPI001EF04977|nr:DRTGG domain-containing protein [Macrococcus brunensis]ULG71313.1 CBS domain-containing protein [Macrococcus brunensis]ULG73619.1 CBS domain-containing protein [Macrococcus brunensis]
MTKHEQIIKHIEALKVGSKISVRQIAKDLSVSEGTAYRAIKDAENRGIVSTMERIGTIRIEKKTREAIENLTFAEIVKIIDGQLIGGRTGLHKSLSRFAIGAMEQEDVTKYLGENTLLIVGNRENIQQLALEKGSAVLVTGGFAVSDSIRQLADQKGLPILSTSHDTFAVANIINRALYDQLIKQEVLTVAEILIPVSETNVLYENDTVGDWKALSHSSGHTRFPVLDDQNRAYGIVTNKDIIDLDNSMKIKRVMTKNPITVNLSSTIATCAHVMIWEGIELLPVVSKNHRLIGIVTREDVLRAMQSIERQPQIGHTLNDQVLKQMKFGDDITIRVTPQMSNQLGTMSKSVFVAIIEEATKHLLKRERRGEALIESLNIYFLKTVPIDTVLTISCEMLDLGRKFAKMEVTIHSEEEIVSKAMLMCQLIEA